MKSFKNTSGQHYLNALFYEMTGADKSTVVYTLKDEPHEGFPSLFQLYLQSGDPTEYQFAKTHLDGWTHWEKLLECQWFKEYVSRWRRELDTKIRSEALVRLLEKADLPGRDQFMINKYLLDGHWKPGRAGRPKKEDIRQAAHDIAMGDKRVQEDFARIIAPTQ